MLEFQKTTNLVPSVYLFTFFISYYSLKSGDSSDDEGRIKNDKDLPKGKQAKLDVWSPTVKIGAVGRRERTSARLHARVEGVQKGIEAASAVLDKVFNNLSKAQY